MKIGLVLEGGGMRGLYTAGVLDVLLDNKIFVDGIIGVSAGALFGINYVSKQRGRSLRYNLNYVNDKRYMGFSSLLKTGNIVNKDFAYYHVPFKEDIFDEKAFEKAKIDYYVVVTNVEDGKPDYIKINNCFEEIEVLRASSSIPFVSKIVEINNKKYLDGGIADSIPFEKMLGMGYDKVIVVLTRDGTYRKRRTNTLIPKLFYKDFPKFVEIINNRYLRYNKCLDKIEDLERKGKVFVIRPSSRIKIRRFEKNVKKLEDVYKLGCDDCNLLLDKIKLFMKKD